MVCFNELLRHQGGKKTKILTDFARFYLFCSILDERCERHAMLLLRSNTAVPRHCPCQVASFFPFYILYHACRFGTASTHQCLSSTFANETC